MKVYGPGRRASSNDTYGNEVHTSGGPVSLIRNISYIVGNALQINANPLGLAMWRNTLIRGGRRASRPTCPIAILS